MRKKQSVHWPLWKSCTNGFCLQCRVFAGEVLEVLRGRAVYQCSTQLTLRVLTVLPLKNVGVYYCGYYPYLQYLGSILRILPELSAIQPLVLLVHRVFAVNTLKSPHCLRREKHAGRIGKQVFVFFFDRPTKITIGHVLTNTRFSRPEWNRITRVWTIGRRQATNDKALSDTSVQY